MTTYFKSGCEANFTALLPSDADEMLTTVTGASLLFLGGCSFMGALLAGIILGKNSKVLRV